MVVYPNSSGVALQNIVSATQAAKGSTLVIAPDSLRGGFDAGSGGGGIVMDGSQAELGYKIDLSTEQKFFADSSGIGHFGKLRAQSAGTSTQFVRTAGASTGGGFFTIIYGFTMPELPFVVGTLIMDTTNSGWQILNCDAGGISATRAVTSNAARMNFLITRGN